MSTLIPSYSITDFKKLKVKELKRLKSCEITSDGEYLFTFVRPQTDFIRTSVENLAQLGNALSGSSLEEINKE